jgi:hypothetical protein
MHVCSGRPDGCRGDGLKQVVPVLEDHIGRDGPQMLEEAVFGATRDDGGSPGKDGEISGGAEGKASKASKLRVTRTLATVSLPRPKPRPKLYSRLYPPVLRALKVSFSIFQRPAAGGQFGHGVG